MSISQGEERILVISHAHPDFSLGGGELAAYNLFQRYREHPAVEHAWFLGRIDRGRSATGALGLRRLDEYLWEQSISDWHLMQAQHRDSLTTRFADLIRALRPTIVHAHHYMHLGLGFLRVIKQVDPSIRVYMTLHEYMAICRNNGQMVKTDGRHLCSRASDEECHRCFPEQSVEDFWLRKHIFMRHFDLIDGFVSPSRFLRQRYIDWGIDPSRITVIENGQADEPVLPPRQLEQGDSRNRFGFFGQLTPYKGLHVPLEGLLQLDEARRRGIVLEVHGANLELQTPEYRDRVQALLQPLIEQGVVQWMGSYAPHELRSRMKGVDWVVVPSTWWENSPMVIQEAFLGGRPVLVSDIGGMAEKVRHDVDGLQIAVGNSSQWARAMAAVAASADAWDRLRLGIGKPMTHEQCASAHLQLFERRPSGSDQVISALSASTLTEGMGPRRP